MSTIQTTENKQGEIEFRRKLVEQHINGKKHFASEFDKTQMENILKARMEKTVEDMSRFKELGYNMSPFLELGAERCQRSLVMVNDLKTEGFAVDISFAMLKSADYYKKTFNKEKMPVRVCCDIYNLPFMSGSVPFAFCYETLHHFPIPAPVINEIYRVLVSGGVFFFAEEPFKQIVHMNLYKGEKGNLKKRTLLKKVLDHFFAKKITYEEDFGVLENEDIPLKAWREALRVFEKKNIKLNFLKKLNTNLFACRFNPKYFLAYLFGGSISGICEKTGANKMSMNSSADVLICPDCVTTGQGESKLEKTGDGLMCKKCNSNYPIKAGVMFLFSKDKLKQLYPEII